MYDKIIAENFSDIEKQKIIKNEWKKFIEGQEPLEVRPEIVKAWRRCQNYGLSPFRKIAPKDLSEEDFSQRLKDNATLIDVSNSAVNNLYTFIKKSDFTVAISEADGYLLSVIGDEYIVKSAMLGNGTVGANWSERAIGNNPIGTSIVENRALQVFGYEHYCICAHKWIGSGAPIHDADGKIIGAISICGERENVHLHTLGMAVMTAYSIEKQLTIIKKVEFIDKEYKEKSVIIDSIDQSLLVINSDRKVSLVNTSFAKQFHVKKEDIIGTDIRQLFYDDLLQSIIANKSKLIDYFADLWVKGQRHSCVITYNPVLDSAGHGVFVIDDIIQAKKFARKIVSNEVNFSFDNIIGNHPAFLESLELAKSIAATNLNILLLGESGTGKDVFAQAIHNFSTRKNGPFISLNCGTIPKELVSSELFGYEEGAFTGTKKQGSKGKFELANSGTIFLDEIGEMPIEIQASLLRVIEQRIIYRLGGQEAIPVNIRIIAATNKDILAAAKAGRFRLDLYYRLNVLPIKLIPLREHKSDIPLLVDSFLAKLSREHNKPVKALSPDVMDILVNYDWPGNIRELKNAIERCIVLSSGENITTKFLQDEIVNFAQNKLAQAEPTHYEHKEKDQLVALLEKYRWNVSKVAAEFGVARSTAYKKLKFYNLLK